MNSQQRDVQRKIKVLRHAEQAGCVARTCRYFGIGRASFYRWRSAYLERGEAGLINAKPIPKNPVNRTPPEIADKVLHLRSTFPAALYHYVEPFRSRTLRVSMAFKLADPYCGRLYYPGMAEQSWWWLNFAD